MGEPSSFNKMTSAKIRALVKKNDLYLNPVLNDVLYLHFQGFDEIACLEDYTELKCLWLDSNAITTIRGLDKQHQLKCLFLQNNLIRRIENLSSCPQLDTLNLSHNQIRSVENCHTTALPALTSLDLSHNHLKTYDQLAQLEQCELVSVLDLSNNRIDDVLVVKILGRMPSLRVLTLTGNPVITLIRNYRKTMILECKSLTYLDNRPVTERDRACAEAWKRGGFAAEREEQDRWIRAANRKTKEDINRLMQKRNERGHQPPFKMLNLDSDEDELNNNNPAKGDEEKEEENNSKTADAAETVGPSSASSEDHHPIAIDNLQSWRNVENILANPELHQTRQRDYLSQFSEISSLQRTRNYYQQKCNDSPAATNSEYHEEEVEKNSPAAVDNPSSEFLESDSLPESTSNQKDSPDDLQSANPEFPLQEPSTEVEEEASQSQPLSDLKEDSSPSCPPQQPQEVPSSSEATPGASTSLPSTSTAPTSSSSTSIFPSFVRVTYPDPVTNQFHSARPSIEVAPKYSALVETKRAKDCPDVEPLFVDQPLARIAIDYEAMRQMPSDYDQVMQDGERQLAEAEEDSLRRYADYVKEVDRIYQESGIGQEQPGSSSTAGGEDNGIESTMKKKEEIESSAVTRNEELKEKLKLGTGTEISSRVEMESGESPAEQVEEKFNLLADLDKLFEFNNKNSVKPQFTSDSSSIAQSSSSTTSNATAAAVACATNLPPLKHHPLGANRCESPSPSSSVQMTEMPGRRNCNIDDCTWIREYLNENATNGHDIDEVELSQITGTIRQLSKERMAQIRTENERIVASIKRLYEDKPEISQMRRNLGAVKQVLLDSQAITGQLQSTGRDDQQEEVEVDDDSQQFNAVYSASVVNVTCISAAGDGAANEEEEAKEDDGEDDDEISLSSGNETVAVENCSPSCSTSSAVGKSSVAVENNEDKKVEQQMNGDESQGDERDAAIEARIKALVDKICGEGEDSPMQLKDIRGGWGEFERKTFGFELGDEIDLSEGEEEEDDSDSEGDTTEEEEE